MRRRSRLVHRPASLSTTRSGADREAGRSRIHGYRSPHLHATRRESARPPPPRPRGALGACPSRLLQPELREDLRVLLFHREDLVARLAICGDGRAVLRLEVPVVAAEAAREVL